MDAMRHKYNQHRDIAKYRNIPFLLTFEEWSEIWLASGKWKQRGNRRGMYCMARFGDQGAYEVGNVSICLIETNRAERNFNYPMRGKDNPAYGKNYFAAFSPEAQAIKRDHTRRLFSGRPNSVVQRQKIAAIARTRRKAMLPNGRWRWAHPGDEDYPE